MNMFRHVLTGFIFAIVIVGSYVGFSQDAIAQSACSGEIVKVANPEDDTPFSFTVFNGEVGEVVVLSDPSDNVFPIGLNPGGTLFISEEPLAGWVLESIECLADGPIEFSVNLGANMVTIDCLDSIGLIQCEFTNVLAPVELAQVPTLSQWGLIAMASILGIVGFLVMRRKKLTA